MDALVIVTGGSSGLGRSALACAPGDARLVDVSRSGPPSIGRQVVHLEADLGDPTTWSHVADAIDAEVGRGPWERMVLLHAAGTITPVGHAAEVDPRAYAGSVLLGSAAGQVIGQRFLAAVATLTDARRELVLISSGAARRAYPGWSAYGAGKAAGDHWARAVHAEQAERGGVRVVSVAPGVVATPMQARVREADPHDFPQVQRFHELHADGALEDPDDVAARLWALLDEPDLDPVVDLRSR